jgi:hypothetical protein
LFIIASYNFTSRMGRVFNGAVMPIACDIPQIAIPLLPSPPIRLVAFSPSALVCPWHGQFRGPQFFAELTPLFFCKTQFAPPS